MKPQEYLKPFTPAQRDEFLSKREGETKLGASIVIPGKAPLHSIGDHKGDIVIVGIPEDIGPRANLGRGGANEAWTAFLKKFLNMQDNKFLDGRSVLLLGNVRVEDLQQRSQEKPPNKLRMLVEELDARVAWVIEEITKHGKIPVVIGGGHNNAFPILMGASKGWDSFNKAEESPLNCINLDAHADFRKSEGRHSGNGFTYAAETGVLEKYAMVGLHEQYNSRAMLETLDSDDKLWYSTFEEELRGGRSIKEQTIDAISHCKSGKTGMELDLDAIENMPASAMTPSGVTSTEARKFVINCTKGLDTAYVHFAEGAPVHAPNGHLKVGKFLAYVVCDFIKAHQQKIQEQANK